MSVQYGDGESALQELIESNQDILGDFIAAMLHISGQDREDPLFTTMELVLVIVGGAALGLLYSFVCFVAAILYCRRKQRHKK